MPRRCAAVAVLWALLLNLLAPGSVAAFVTVGSGGPPCDFTDLQTAIDSSPDNSEFHVVGSYRGKPIKFQDKTLRIYGSYTDCTGATQAPAPISTLDGLLDSGTKPVLQIDGQVSLDLRGFVIANGHNGGHEGGGFAFSAVAAVPVSSRTTSSSTTTARTSAVAFSTTAAQIPVRITCFFTTTSRSSTTSPIMPAAASGSKVTRA